MPVPPMPERVIVPLELSPVSPVKVPAATRFAPCAVKAVVPPETIFTFPVDADPSCNVCALVVPRTPVAVREVALLLAPETEAVGVPELTLITANFAEVVDV